MDKQEHARALRAAMAERGYDRRVISDATGVEVRTVTNWTTGKTMPDESARVALVKLFGGEYVHKGDAVERALRESELIEWRQDSVLSTYKKHLHEQRGEATG